MLKTNINEFLIILTNVNRHSPTLMSHILIVLSLDPEIKNGPLLVFPFPFLDWKSINFSFVLLITRKFLDLYTYYINNNYCRVIYFIWINFCEKIKNVYWWIFVGFSRVMTVCIQVNRSMIVNWNIWICSLPLSIFNGVPQKNMNLLYQFWGIENVKNILSMMRSLWFH